MWDEAKRLLNLEKHGVDFSMVPELDWSLGFTLEQRQKAETRYLTYAPIGSRLYAVVWTRRGNSVRIISFRKANRREVERYG